MKAKAAQRLSVLDPDKNTYETECPPQQSPDAKQLDEYLAKLACSANAEPHVARGLILYRRIRAAGVQIATIADRLRRGMADSKSCPGVEGLIKTDWALLDELVERVQKAATKTSEPSEPGARHHVPGVR